MVALLDAAVAATQADSLTEFLGPVLGNLGLAGAMLWFAKQLLASHEKNMAQLKEGLEKSIKEASEVNQRVIDELRVAFQRRGEADAATITRLLDVSDAGCQAIQTKKDGGAR